MKNKIHYLKYSDMYLCLIYVDCNIYIYIYIYIYIVAILQSA